ncbi:bifunctional diaminohydroxyphosphoribosylaminopyrimidine deaminase/5-amino-6-(5-phosphoribosylamino)uracil reductase RibD [Candidatus Oleimmundimicrobium sp.]|uniref:bifunctional diaminohydroxyphosphoribosylaminopyrimidine deaminase/5-amino-6-(5-phosphoribosylamino)uracil reductase RibD n=1 Tax=Candidatus Oleimmundimicrobium sp. TaxID=3060597 RepID=UPI00271B20EE|nr:bifunctional diaminohydroxyphosphoribosylaminopyrimidine deaminase/5-amino-6-(5-phosphoribosylamino)uracil reductase RibD [Candidatus Oleimmundimicrobium sp.]MDO8885384.1 bifunctional diaminohydroxyphosphoribosylaminopyrimidine deaminase/5-amino-6-(5-phosphoribosylamino)uracil reductase RibD [Candidatus Oleimmundimicrobium sp.]
MEYLDNIYMKRAIKIAEKGRGRTSPNPMVGAVIVKNGVIIGEGYHAWAGEPHAEINALKSVNETLEGSTLYVTLEPCCNYGKTPPCTEAIISSKIKKVIIGLTDPNPKVNGKGIEELRKAQIETEVGLFKKEIAKQNEVYIKYVTTKNPFILMKMAISFDGKTTSKNGQTTKITDEKSKKYVHGLRDKYDAIMVGIGTVLADDPMLTARLDKKEGRNPLRVIVDSKARLPLSSKIVKTADKVLTLLVTTKGAPLDKLKALSEKKVQILTIPNKKDKVDLKFLLEELGRREITSVILEGGPRLVSSALREELVDKMVFLVAPKIIGGESSLDFVADKEISFNFNFENPKLLGKDLLIEAYPGIN